MTATDAYNPPAPIAPPQDLDAEQSVLGAVLLADSMLTAAEDEGLKAEHFYRGGHGIIFQTMQELAAKGDPIDSVTLMDKLSQTGRLEQVGGPAAVQVLAGSVPALGNLRNYARIVRRQWVRRHRLLSTYEQQAAIYEDDDDAWSKAHSAADHDDLDAASTEIDPAEDFLQWYDGVKGLPTPYPQLTAAIGGGLVPGDITIISAWPGFGKTILSDTFVLHAHRAEPDARFHIYLNELNPGIRTARMLARMTKGEIPWQSIRERELTDSQMSRVKRLLPDLPAKYERAHGWKAEDYVRHIRRKRWDMCVIDSASRIPVRDTHELEQAVGMLADVGGETGCHIILIVQLNLERCKQLERPMPLGRDLLGGGAWYRDARNVVFVHRAQEMVEINGQTKAVPVADSMIYADKATHGEPESSMVLARFNAKTMTFDATEGGASSGPRPSGSTVGGTTDTYESRDTEPPPSSGSNKKGKEEEWPF